MQKTPQDIFKAALLKLPESIIPIVKTFENYGKETIKLEKLSQAYFMINLLPAEYIIEEFVKNSFQDEGNCFWDFVAQRSEISILKGLCNIFNSVISYENVSEIFNERDQNSNLIISDKIKEDFFVKIDNLIKLAIRYVHEKRCPYSIKNNGVLEKFYEKEYLEMLDVTKYSKIFFGKILSFPIYDA